MIRKDVEEKLADIFFILCFLFKNVWLKHSNVPWISKGMHLIPTYIFPCPFSTHHPGPQHCLLLAFPFLRPDQCKQWWLPEEAPGQSWTFWPFCICARFRGLYLRPPRLGGGGGRKGGLDAWGGQGVYRQKRPHLRLSRGRFLDDLSLWGRVLGHDETQHYVAFGGPADSSKGATGLRVRRSVLLQSCEHEAHLHLQRLLHWKDVPLLLPWSQYQREQPWPPPNLPSQGGCMEQCDLVIQDSPTEEMFLF